MKTDNELIAEFMGYKLQKSHFRKELVYEIGDCDSLQPDGSNEYLPEYLHYNTSWDWLMPVVEKIAKLYVSHTPKKTIDKIMTVSALPLSVPRDKAYKAVVEFIKWYNKQKS